MRTVTYPGFLEWADAVEFREHIRVVRPCHAPGEARCDTCPLAPGITRTSASIDAADVMKLLTGVPSVTDGERLAGYATRCGTLLDTPGHKYSPGGSDHTCKRCGTLQSHDIHRFWITWQATRERYGFGL